MARPTHKILATVGTYKDSEGNEKKRYVQVGVAFTDDQGRISQKMDAMPISPDWSGWLQLFPMDDDRRELARPAKRTIPPKQYVRDDGFEEDSIPF